MAVTYTKKEQGSKITSGTGAPVHSAVVGDEYKDLSNGDKYVYQSGAWIKVSVAITLTTTGTSGAATLTGNTLNIPQYSGGGASVVGGADYLYLYNNFK